MAGAERRAKDAAMAAHLRGVERTHCRCPICHAVVSLATLTTHLMSGHNRANFRQAREEGTDGTK